MAQQPGAETAVDLGGVLAAIPALHGGNAVDVDVVDDDALEHGNDPLADGCVYPAA
jgi:hypothetical protein